MRCYLCECPIEPSNSGYSIVAPKNEKEHKHLCSICTSLLIDIKSHIKISGRVSINKTPEGILTATS